MNTFQIFRNTESAATYERYVTETQTTKCAVKRGVASSSRSVEGAYNAYVTET